MDSIYKMYKTRRGFLKLTGILAVTGAMASQLWIAVRYLLSPASREAKQKWKVGDPEKFDIGITFVTEAKTFIIRDGNEFKALSAICTHLGCTLKKVRETCQTESGGNFVTEFHCPCHGSKFNASGERIAGPSEKPLRYIKITLNREDKQLMVNHAIYVDPDYFLEIP